MQQIRLHLGPHKTATTYMQYVLDALRPEMAAAGQFYATMGSTRATLTDKINCAQYAGNAGLRRFYAQRRALAELRRMGSRFEGISHDLLLSDENLLGEPGDCLAGRLYPMVSTRLARLRDALPGRVTEVFFCLRDYAPFLASLHTEAIRWGTDVKPAMLVDAFAQPQRHWSDLLWRMQEVFPRAQFHIWPYEDFASLRAELLAKITGLSEASVAAVPDRVLRPGISQVGVEAALKAFEVTSGHLPRQAAVLAAEALCPRQTAADKYDPWPADLRKAMSLLYIAEMAELRSTKCVNLVSSTHGAMAHGAMAHGAAVYGAAV